MTDTKHAGTPPKLTQSFLDPYCAVDQAGKPVLEMLHSFEPGIAGEYLRSIIEAFNSHAALAEDNAQLRKALKMLYERWGNGTPSYEDPEDKTGYLGLACKVTAMEEQEILAALEQK